MFPSMSGIYSPDIFETSPSFVNSVTFNLSKHYKIIDLMFRGLKPNGPSTHRIEVSIDGLTYSTPLVMDIASTGEKSGFARIMNVSATLPKLITSMLSKDATNFSSGSNGFINSQRLTTGFVTGIISYVRISTSGREFLSGQIVLIGWP